MKRSDELKAFLDGELSPEQADAVRQALLNDPELRKEMDEYKKISEAIQHAYSPAQTKGMNQAVESAEGVLSAERGRFRPSRLGYVMGGIAAGAVVLAFIGFLASGGLRDTVSTGLVSVSPQVESAAGYDRLADAEQPAVDYAPSGAASPADVEGFVNEGGTLIAKDGSLSLTVDDLNQSVSGVESIAESLGGYVERSETAASGHNSYSSIQIRVPANSFENAMTRLKALGEVTREAVEGNDITAEFVDVSARLRALEAEEKQYLEMYNSSRSVDDMVKVRDKLAEVRMSIESLTARQKNLASRGMMSTITVELAAFVAPSPRPVAANWFTKSWTDAFAGLSAFAKSMGTGAIYLIVYSPVWVPILIFAVILWRKRRAQPAS